MSSRSVNILGVQSIPARIPLYGVRIRALWCPPECLEYLVVHEMVHLLEPTHNERFVGLMNRFMPNWRNRRNLLNSLPVRHESWGY